MYFAESRSVVRKSFVLVENHIQLWVLILQAGRVLCQPLSVNHKLFRAQVMNYFSKAPPYIVAKVSSHIGATLIKRGTSGLAQFETLPVEMSRSYLFLV